MLRHRAALKAFIKYEQQGQRKIEVLPLRLRTFILFMASPFMVV
jgi:hypothetical protein